MALMHLFPQLMGQILQSAKASMVPYLAHAHFNQVPVRGSGMHLHEVANLRCHCFKLPGECGVDQPAAPVRALSPISLFKLMPHQ